MKRVLFSAILVLGVVSNIWAHDQPPISLYVQFSKNVCIVKATTINNGVVTFTVENVIKGEAPSILTLKVIEVPVEITVNSEWLLASTGKEDNSVGWAMKGDYGWVNAPIQRVDGKIHLVGKYGYVDPTMAADASKGLNLEQLEDLAKTPLPN